MSEHKRMRGKDLVPRVRGPKQNPMNPEEKAKPYQVSLYKHERDQLMLHYGTLTKALKVLVNNNYPKL